MQSGHAKLALGKIDVRSRITPEYTEVNFAVLHFGDHNLNAAVRAQGSEDEYKAMLAELRDAFSGADLRR